MARIRTLIKVDPHVTIASQESVFLIAKATELFVDSLAKNMYRITQQQKRKTIQKKDLEAVIEVMDEFAFLDGTTE
uniref:Transcription factor CBF/NF-Y/archaeal histone domain-containing protein n=2 Tax=Ciona intestinalis TaxID=7719 RepID=F7BPT5_CIOIN